jgi:hypothetical protein
VRWHLYYAEKGPFSSYGLSVAKLAAVVAAVMLSGSVDFAAVVSVLA